MDVHPLMWFAVAPALYGGLAASLPAPGPPSARRLRWRAWRAHLVDVMTGRERRRRNAPPTPPDPFATLTLQLRLADLSAQLRRLESDPQVWARGRREQAVQAAYDALLLEACRLAEIDVPEGTPPWLLPEPERFREELALAERGWSW